MPFTFQDRVEDYVGTISDTGGLTDWLTAGARRVIDLIPPAKATRYLKEVTIADAGTSIASYRIFDVVKSGYYATPAPVGLATQLALSGSLHYAVATSPRYIVKAGTLIIFPSAGGGLAYALPYPSDVYFSLASIPNFPEEGEELVILYAAVQYVLWKVGSIAATVAAYTVPYGSAPSAPTAPVVTPPVSPTLATVSYSDATVGSIASTSITTVTLPAAVDDTLEPAGLTGTWSIPTLSLSTYITAMDAAFTATDVELAAGNIQRIQAMLQKCETELKLENDETDVIIKRLMYEVERYNADLRRYQTELGGTQINLQKAIAQAQLDQDRLKRVAEMTTEVNLANEYRTMEAIIANNRSLLEKYQAEVIAYKAEWDAYASAVQAYGAQIQAYVAQIREENDHIVTQIQAQAMAVQSYQFQVTALQKAYIEALTLFTGRAPNDAPSGS